jgi:hypothetical protein
MNIESRNMHRRVLAIVVTGTLVIAAARAPFYGASAQSVRPTACSEPRELTASSGEDAGQTVSLDRACAPSQCCPPLRPIVAPVTVKLAAGEVRLAAK